MSLQNLFGELAIETTQEQLLAQTTLLLAAILEKMARVDGNDRMTVAIESGAVGISGGQTLATVTAVGSCNVNQFGGRDSAHTVYALANAGAVHIYDNIKVS